MFLWLYQSTWETIWISFLLTLTLILVFSYLLRKPNNIVLKTLWKINIIYVLVIAFFIINIINLNSFYENKIKIWYVKELKEYITDIWGDIISVSDDEKYLTIKEKCYNKNLNFCKIFEVLEDIEDNNIVLYKNKKTYLNELSNKNDNLSNSLSIQEILEMKRKIEENDFANYQEFTDFSEKLDIYIKKSEKEVYKLKTLKLNWNFWDLYNWVNYGLEKELIWYFSFFFTWKVFIYLFWGENVNYYLNWYNDK